MAGISKTKYSAQAIENMSFDDGLKVKMVELIGADGVLKNPATTEGQEAIVSAVQNITIPAPTGGATSVNQETLISLIGTLQELVQRLAPLASAMNAGAPALRTTPIASVSTAVTGTVAVSAVTNLTNFGTGTPAKEVADDINSQMIHICNINNVTAS